MFDDVLLQDYMQNFYGYGNFDGDFWFVGMEEGGGDSFADVQKRISVWLDRGRKSLEDLRDYHYAIGVTKWFDETSQPQSTWNRLISILWTSHGVTPQAQDILFYQRMKLGRLQASHCLVELLPLPSPSTNNWLYSEYSRLPFLVSRNHYFKHTAPIRADYLRQNVRQYEPKVVVFYSANKIYRRWWMEIANVAFTEDDPAIGTNGKTLFIIMQHPVAHGVTSEYFRQVGQKIRKHISSSP